MNKNGQSDKINVHLKPLQDLQGMLYQDTIYQTIKSPYPAYNVWRRNELVATGTIYAEVAAIDTNEAGVVVWNCTVPGMTMAAGREGRVCSSRIEAGGVERLLFLIIGE